MIIINGALPINDNRQWIFLTLTINGDECKFTHAAPADLTGQDLQDYVDAREDDYKLDILKDMYFGAKPVQAPDLTELANFEMWISMGQMNVDEGGNEIFIPEVSWVGTHPEKMNVFGMSQETLNALEELEATDKHMARVTEDLIEILKAKALISDTDFNANTLTKINNRKSLRDKLK